MFSPPVCLSVFLHDISKSDAARITKLDLKMLHDEYGKPIYFGTEGQRSRSRVAKTLPAWVVTPVSAGFFWLFLLLCRNSVPQGIMGQRLKRLNDMKQWFISLIHRPSWRMAYHSFFWLKIPLFNG